MFQKYKAQRNEAYRHVVNNIVTVITVFLIALTVFTCIMFGSAKPLWILALTALVAIVGVIQSKKDFTKGDEEKYLHNGGLFFVSYARFIEEEKWHEKNSAQ